MSKRITLPENTVGLILSRDEADDLMSLLLTIRANTLPRNREALEPYRQIAGDITLRILEGQRR